MQFVLKITAILAGLLVLTASFLWLSHSTRPTEKYEPTTDTIRSGKCIVDVCSSVDMGDYTFRYYAEYPTVRTLQYIPKGQCQCKVVRPTKLKRDHVSFDAIGKDGRTLTHVSVVSTGRGYHQPPTIQEFKEKRRTLEEITDFDPGGDALKSYRIYRSREPLGAQVYDYYLIPRERLFSFHGKTQPIAFNVPNGLRHGPPLPTQLGDRTPNFSSAIRLYGSIRMYQFFNPRFQRSDHWTDILEQSAEMVDTRLFSKD